MAYGIKTLTFEKSLNILKVLGAQYIIVDKDGVQHVHGDLKLAVPEEPKKRLPPGTLKNVYYPVLSGMVPGDDAKIPVPEGVTLEAFRSAISAWCSGNWGNGSAVTQCVDNAVEVLRLE